MAARPDSARLTRAGQREMALTLIPAILLWGAAAGGFAAIVFQPAPGRGLVWVGVALMLASVLGVVAMVRLQLRERVRRLAKRGLGDGSYSP